MLDTRHELEAHLNFMMRAYGSVLVTGLGLGCVARGLLANPRVKEVVVIELSGHVLTLVAPHMPKTCRLSIVQGDAHEAVRFAMPGDFDCAWHDLWTDQTLGIAHLQNQHMALIGELFRKVKLQGAWGLPRYVRRHLLRGKVNLI